LRPKQPQPVVEQQGAARRDHVAGRAFHIKDRAEDGPVIEVLAFAQHLHLMPEIVPPVWRDLQFVVIGNRDNDNNKRDLHSGDCNRRFVPIAFGISAEP